MSDKIKGVIVDKDYLEELESIKESFAYRIITASIGGMNFHRQATYSKEEFKELINTEFVQDILASVNKRNKKKIEKVLNKYKVI